MRTVNFVVMLVVAPSVLAGLAHITPRGAVHSTVAVHSPAVPLSRLDAVLEPPVLEAPVLTTPPRRSAFPKLKVNRSYGLQTEYQLNQGKAIDVLQHDYPHLFDLEPDFSIFADDVELWDPTGKRVEGLAQYRRIFDMFRFLRTTAMSRAEVSYRVVVNDGTIRIRWNAKLWMRGEMATVHLDGISAYELDKLGMIRRHRLENIVLTGGDAQKTQLAFAWPHAGLADVGIPAAARPFFRSVQDALRLESSSLPLPSGAPPLPLAPLPLPLAGGGLLTPLRMGLPKPAQRRSPPPQATEVGGAGHETPFERAKREREEDAAKERARLAMARDIFAEKERGNPFGGFLNSLSKPQACESNYDCEQPLVCCDLIVASVCCSSGMMVGKPQPQLQEQLIPIPVEREPDDGLPPGFPRGPAPTPQAPNPWGL